MAELQRLLQQNGAFKSELMQAFLQPAQQSFREHQRNNNGNDNLKNKKNSRPGTDTGYTTSSTLSSPSMTETSHLTGSSATNKNINQSLEKTVGIIEDSLDNVKIDSDNTTSTTGNSATLTTSSSATSEFIKAEPELDNSQFSIMDNMKPTFKQSNEQSTETMMMPDMMKMMKDFDPSMMMGSGMPPMPQDMPSGMMEEGDDNANEIDVERILEEVKQVPSDLRKQLIDHVIETVGKAHFETVTPTHAKVKAANEKFEKKMKEGHMPDFSKMPIDPSMIWQKFVNSMVYEVTQAVRFCKKLPGFGEVHQDDQITLVKKGSFEILLNRMCLLVDHVKLEMFDPTMEMKCPRIMVEKMPMGFFIKEFFNVAAQMNPLRLTDEEIGIFSAALVMSPNHENLDNVVIVEKLHILFLQSLYYEMKKNHNDYENKFARLLGIIPVFKMINKKHTMVLNKMKMQKDPVMDGYPALPKEIYVVADKN